MSAGILGESRIMKWSLSALAAVLLLSSGPSHAESRTLTISVYGFAQDAYKRLVYDRFEARCGCKLVVETGNSVERLAKMEANKANPIIDMAVVSMADVTPPSSLSPWRASRRDGPSRAHFTMQRGGRTWSGAPLRA